ncbi:cytochrome b5-related protein-like [Penaeus monodon]|uniref:cytochrome b5-related protein-like n=1 Tax=Penaeus monodon TaxID=6687 RepID=UPI0018A7207E|nr:cytochrome b5-related protein-like [Penaeus monodon]
MPPRRDDVIPENEAGKDVNSNSFPGFKRYPTNRDHPLKSALKWIKGKRDDDAVGPYWRIHDGLYDLTEFAERHPGGKVWIESTKGTDITEAFESAHLGTQAQALLPKYFVKHVEEPRNSPYTFHEDGFYKTFKRKVRPVLKEVGTGPDWAMVLIQDGLASATALSVFAACLLNSTAFAVLGGIFLAMTSMCAHNFFHQRDNWRMFLFDLTFLSSYDWRITHGLSHHIYTNTFYDFEVSILEPFWEFLPKPEKNFLQRYGSCAYEYLLIPVAMYMEALKRICLVLSGEAPLRPENLLPLLELVAMCLAAPSFGAALRLWLVLHAACSSWFTGVGLVVAHHHPEIYHEGDAMREDRDWGLCQLDAVRDRVEVTGNLFLVATVFGDHSLHHLLPTVDHSKLKYVYPVFLETCKEFNMPFSLKSQWEMVCGKYLQLANNKPNKCSPSYKSKTS